MKRILRHFIIDVFALFSAYKLAEGLVFAAGAETFILTAVALTIATLFGKPIINVLLLPLNLVTFGIFRWVSSAVALYIVTLVVDGFSIERFTYSGLSTQWFYIPAVSFSMPLMAYVSYAFIISVITSALHRIFD